MTGVLMAALSVSAPVLGQEAASDYPSKPIRILVGFTPGGGPDEDLLLPHFAQLRRDLAAGMVARAAPDGYTLLSVSSAHAIAAAIYPKLSYNAFSDLSGITVSRSS